MLGFVATELRANFRALTLVSVLTGNPSPGPGENHAIRNFLQFPRCTIRHINNAILNVRNMFYDSIQFGDNIKVKEFTIYKFYIPLNYFLASFYKYISSKIKNTILVI